MYSGIVSDLNVLLVGGRIVAACQLSRELMCTRECVYCKLCHAGQISGVATGIVVEK
jgi:hypothetical protein